MQIPKLNQTLQQKEANKGSKRSIEDLFSDQEFSSNQKKRHKRSDIPQPGTSKAGQLTDVAKGLQLQAPKFNEERNSWQVYVLVDNNSLFWSVALAYLIPVKDKDEDFKDRFRRLFEDKRLDKLDQIKTLVQDYNPFLNTEDIYKNETLKELIRQFRNLVFNYKPLSDKHIGHVGRISVILNCKISGLGSDIYALRQSTPASKLELFKDNNHYNFGLDKGIGDEYVHLIKVNERLEEFVRACTRSKEYDKMSILCEKYILCEIHTQAI